MQLLFAPTKIIFVYGNCRSQIPSQCYASYMYRSFPLSAGSQRKIQRIANEEFRIDSLESTRFHTTETRGVYPTKNGCWTNRGRLYASYFF